MLLAVYPCGVPVQCGFNGHPPLGVNATEQEILRREVARAGFNGHPPLGVNATGQPVELDTRLYCFNGHPPLGVNATMSARFLKKHTL